MTVLWLLFVGCGEKDTEDDSATADECTAEYAEYGLTWDNWGQSFFAAYCDSCHAAESPNRFGAPEGISFDSAAEVETWASSIETTVLVDESMPLGGGVGEEERYLLTAYLRCGI